MAWPPSGGLIVTRHDSLRTYRALTSRHLIGGCCPVVLFLSFAAGGAGGAVEAACACVGWQECHGMPPCHCDTGGPHQQWCQAAQEQCQFPLQDPWPICAAARHVAGGKWRVCNPTCLQGHSPGGLIGCLFYGLYIDDFVSTGALRRGGSRLLDPRRFVACPRRQMFSRLVPGRFAA